MSQNEIIRAWKDEDYRNELTEAQRSQLPENPAGEINLSEEEMESSSGGGSHFCCGGRLSRALTNPVVGE